MDLGHCTVWLSCVDRMCRIIRFPFIEFDGEVLPREDDFADPLAVKVAFIHWTFLTGAHCPVGIICGVSTGTERGLALPETRWTDRFERLPEANGDTSTAGQCTGLGPSLTSQQARYCLIAVRGTRVLIGEEVRAGLRLAEDGAFSLEEFL